MNIQELKTIPILSDLPEKILELIADVLEEKLYTDGAVIFNEGSEGNTFYIIKSGEIIISKKKTLALLQTGDFFGEMSLIDRRPRSATAIAKGMVNLYALSYEHFQELMQAEPETVQIFIFHLLETVVRRLRQTNRELITVYEVGQILNTTDDIKKITSQVLTRLMEEVEAAEYGLIALWNEIVQEFELTASCGYGPDDGEKLLFPLSDPVVNYLYSKQDHLQIKNWEQELSSATIKQFPFHGLSLVAAPFIMHNRCCGFIILTNKTREHAFTLDQLNMLSGISVQLSHALENLKHLAEEKAYKRLKSTTGSM